MQMTDAMEAALVAPVVRPALLVSMAFATETAYAWSGLGDLLWNGNTFKGVGAFGAIGAIEETAEVEAKGTTLELSGIPADQMNNVLNETRLLGRVNVWLACFDATGAIIADPVMAYQGMMDAPAMEDGGDTCTASINIESIFVDLNRACYRRYTNEDQQSDYPGDTGMQYVAGLQEQITFWGRTPSSINNV